MSADKFRWVLVGIFAVGAGGTAQAAASCRLPSGWVDSSPPSPEPASRLVSRTEEISISRPLAAVLQASEATPLEQTIQKTGSLPVVTGTYALTGPAFPASGAKRLVCLSDGSTLMEQVLIRTVSEDHAVFRYVVWGYSSPQARPIAYGVGEFVHISTGEDRTHVRWTYSFRLRQDRFPGLLGPLGRFLFRLTFLDRAYASMMRATLLSEKAAAEAAAGPDSLVATSARSDPPFAHVRLPQGDD